MDGGRPAEMFALDAATCAVLLTTQQVGRLVSGGEEPVIVPLNYRMVDGVIIFRTSADSRVAGAIPGPVVFEVDMFDERTRSGWSVIVHGMLQVAPAGCLPAEVETWAPGERDQWMVLAVGSLSGRLLRGAVDGDTHAAGGYL